MKKTEITYSIICNWCERTLNTNYIEVTSREGWEVLSKGNLVERVYYDDDLHFCDRKCFSEFIKHNCP